MSTASARWPSPTAEARRRSPRQPGADPLHAVVIGAVPLALQRVAQGVDGVVLAVLQQRQDLTGARVGAPAVEGELVGQVAAARMHQDVAALEEGDPVLD